MSERRPASRILANHSTKPHRTGIDAADAPDAARVLDDRALGGEQREPRQRRNFARAWRPACYKREQRLPRPDRDRGTACCRGVAGDRARTSADRDRGHGISGRECF